MPKNFLKFIYGEILNSLKEWNVIIFLFDYILDLSAPPPPPPHKISNNILKYLTSYRILAPSPLPVSKIGLCRQGPGGGGGTIMPKNCLSICRNLQKKSEIFLFDYSFGF